MSPDRKRVEMSEREQEVVRLLRGLMPRHVKPELLEEAADIIEAQSARLLFAEREVVIGDGRVFVEVKPRRTWVESSGPTFTERLRRRTVRGGSQTEEGLSPEERRQLADLRRAWDEARHAYPGDKAVDDIYELFGFIDRLAPPLPGEPRQEGGQ